MFWGERNKFCPGVLLGSVWLVLLVGFWGKEATTDGDGQCHPPACPSKSPLQSPRSPLRVSPVSAGLRSLPGPPGPGCSFSEGTPGGKRRSQRFPPSIPPSPHPSILPSLLPSIPPSRRGFSISQQQRSDFLSKIKGKPLQRDVRFQPLQPNLRVHLSGTAARCPARSTTGRKRYREAWTRTAQFI